MPYIHSSKAILFVCGAGLWGRVSGNSLLVAFIGGNSHSVAIIDTDNQCQYPRAILFVRL
ncbi:MAG: hypothetical protein MJE68_32560 [Proteobacteria bacterium]|nr:hypothetical protein [Pseudomonadota bacterium]